MDENKMVINEVKIIKCPFCTFDIWIIHNERLVICNHCRQTVDITIWSNLEKYKQVKTY